MSAITRTVWVLSVISLCTDAASEMLYPVMPAYLKSVGFSVVFIGILEGLAEATAGLSKGYFGKRSDLSGKRVLFVRTGYSLSAIAKPMMVFLISPVWIFICRTTDRLGKGIRTGARDAILAEESSPATKARIFGFHRSMDTAGAVIGPAFALVYLYFNPAQYRHLFLYALIPGAVSIMAAFILKEKNNQKSHQTDRPSFFSFVGYWKESSVAYRKLVFGLLLFALFNSSDVFLLLHAKQSGIDDTSVIGLYIFYNLVYALFAFPLGAIADKVGLKKMLIAGIFIFSVVYSGMSITSDFYLMVILFFLYGIYAAATDGIAKAWISNITDKSNQATALGSFAGLQSIGSLLSSTFAGIIWFEWGANTAFLSTAIGAAIVLIYFLLSKIQTH